MKSTTLRSHLLVAIVLMTACGVLLPTTFPARARQGDAPGSSVILTANGAISNERPQDPPELKVGPDSTYSRPPLAGPPLAGPPLAGPEDPVTVIVELEDEPAAQVFARERERGAIFNGDPLPQTSAAVRAQIERVERAQQAVSRTLTGPRFNARLLSRVQRVLNAVTVSVASGKLGEIAELPGVKSVYPAGVYHRMLDTSVQFIGAPRVWDPDIPGGGFTGNGVVIAMIDDGIDYIHTNFGGSGSANDYTINNPAVLGDVMFPTAKVIGGVDFAGDNFDASSTDPAKTTPQPDPDPFACDDHGTKVAGVAAGYGVNANGTTYRGPYKVSTPFSTLRVGPGVAPEASLLAWKVFGCGGTTRGDLIVQAIDRALDPNGDGNFSDRADIINMSLGSPFFPLPGAPELTAIDNAAQAGVFAVVAAGNSGDTYYSINGLGQGANALSVAATFDNGYFFQNVRVNSPFSAQFPATVAAFGPRLTPNITTVTGFGSGSTPSITAEVITAELISALPKDACSSLTNAPGVQGKIAFIDRGTCNLVTKVRNAQIAGAAAVIIGNNVDNQPFVLGDDGTGRDIRIPSFMITRTDAARIQREFDFGFAVNVTLDPANVSGQPGLANTVPASSSRGGVFRGAIKPDIAAPGVNIATSLPFSGDASGFFGGTSMSAPHASGAVALLLDTNPNLTPREVKARLYSTGRDAFFGQSSGLPKYGPTSVGAGTLDVDLAVGTNFYYAYGRGGDDSGSLRGEVKQAVENEIVPFTWQIVNKGNTALTFNVSYDRTSDIPGVELLFQPTVNAPGNSTTNFQIDWSLTPALMKHTRDPVVPAILGANPRHWLSEDTGYLTFTPAAGRPQRIPAYYAARPASRMGTTQNSLNLTGETGTSTLNLTGQQVQTGSSFPTDEVSLASPFEWQYFSPNETLTPTKLDFLDIQYVGVRANPPASGGIANTRLLFGISTYGDWNSLNQLTFNVFIDVDQNGTDDFQLVNTSATNEQGAPSDVFVTQLRNIATGVTTTQFFVNAFSAAQFNTAPFNTNVVVLPVAASALGLTANDAKFNYQVKTSAGNVIIDLSRLLTFDAARPGLEYGTNSIFFDLNNGTIPYGFSVPNLQANDSLGALILHHHNTRGNRAQLLPTGACAAVTVNPTALPAGLAGASYQQQLAASGGSDPITWSVSGGALPQGLTLNAQTGLLSGTAAARGNFNFTVRATDARGCSGERAYTLAIVCPTISVDPATLPAGVLGMSYTQLLTVSGGSDLVVWDVTAGAVPNGLTLDPLTGLLTGTATAGGNFNFTVRATDLSGCTGTRSYTVTIAQPGLQFYALPTAVRLLDTRTGESGCFTPGAPLIANTVRTQSAVGSCSGIPSSAEAIVGNATVVNFITPGAHKLTIYPSDAAQPNSASLDFIGDEVLTKEFTVKLGQDRAFKVVSTATTQLVVEISGYYAPPSVEGHYFHALPKPVRLLDTRTGESGCFTPGAPLGADAVRTQPAQVSCGGVTIPTSAKAIAGNATALGSTSTGFNPITLYPSGATRPNTFNLNYAANQIVANAILVGLSNDGEFNIHSRIQTHFIVDVTGYFSDQPLDANGAGLLYHPLPTPVRLLDTRTGATACDAPGARLGTDAVRTQMAHRTCSGVTIPSTAGAILGNTTVVNFAPTGLNWLTLYPSGATPPNSFNTVYGSGRSLVSNPFITGLSSAGTFNIYSRVSTDLVIDVSGYFAPDVAPGFEGDVAPRPGGDGALTDADQVQAGRLLIGLDEASPGTEFQRVDSAPRAGKGNGGITITDWAQAGRYAEGLDPISNSGGPHQPTFSGSPAPEVGAGTRAGAASAQNRTLRAVNANFTAGQANTLQIEIDALGGENAFVFSLNYDPNALGFVSAETGSDAAGASLLVNSAQAAQGRVVIALALPAGQGLTAGTRRIVRANFNLVAGSAAPTTAIGFGDDPVARGVANVNADEVAAGYASAQIGLIRVAAHVSAASFSGATLAGESIVAAFGTALATRTEVATAVPLPTTLAGTTVRVRDSAGAERLASLFFVSAGQINYAIPPGTALGMATITITGGDGAVSTGTVLIEAVAPGIFAANADAQGVAAAQVLRVKSDGSQVFEQVAVFDAGSGRFVAAPIDLGPPEEQVFLVLFGTGIRFRSNLPAVQLRVGGTNLEALFAGAQGTFVGLDQLNALLPRSLAGRGSVQVALTVDGKAANVVEISIR